MRREPGARWRRHAGFWTHVGLSGIDIGFVIHSGWTSLAVSGRHMARGTPVQLGSRADRGRVLRARWDDHHRPQRRRVDLPPRTIPTLSPSWVLCCGPVTASPSPTPALPPSPTTSGPGAPRHRPVQRVLLTPRRPIWGLPTFRHGLSAAQIRRTPRGPRSSRPRAACTTLPWYVSA